MKRVKPIFFGFVVLALAALALGIFVDRAWLVPAVLAAPFVAIGLHDVAQRDNAILRNFPIAGHVRYLAEAISPEIQQYFIERHTDGKPISRNHRNVVYERAEGRSPTHPYGTERELYDGRYRGLLHSLYPVAPLAEPPRVVVGGEACAQPYAASLLNVSAMSYGALGPTAIRALAAGARQGGFYLNTGEGSLTPHHLSGGGDLVWQIGTGYFGCRTDDGGFDADAFSHKATEPQVRMIELKLSQGAKPGHGGVLPARKNLEEIAAIRGVRPHTTVLSPPGHREFDDAEGLLRFVDRLRELSGGKPTGCKLCVGRGDEFDELCRVMARTGTIPDFVTIDGAEGGTGAAPLEYSDSVGWPLRYALPRVDATLREHGLRDRVRVIASGKIVTSYDVLEALALGADLCNAARAFMLSLGCIQALRCDTNSCPSGVATMDPRLYRGLVPEQKKDRVEMFHRRTLEATLELSAAVGVADPRDVTFDRFVELPCDIEGRLDRRPWKPAHSEARP
ncbi:MAG: FMN-binding glutamate synthase family protein [bacterium]